MKKWCAIILFSVLGLLALAQGLREPAFIASLHYVEAGEAPSSPSSLVTNLVAYWRLDEVGSNTSRADVVGTNTLTDINNVQSSSTSLFTNSCYFVSNSLQRLSAVPGPAFNKSNEMWAIAMWVKFVHTNVPHQIAGQWSSANPREWVIAIQNNQTIVLVLNTNGSQGPVMISSAKPNTAAWHMLAVMHDGTNAVMWVDLNKTTSATGTSLPTTNVNRTLYFGHDGHSGQPYFEGYIDEIAYWKGRVLSDQAITNLYNSGNGVTYPFTGVP